MRAIIEAYYRRRHHYSGRSRWAVSNTLAAVLLVTFAAGCSQLYRYSKPGFDQTQYNRDIGECRLMARAGRQTTTSGAYGVYSSTTTPTNPDPDIVNDCMRSKGYKVQKCSNEDPASCRDYY